MINKETLKAIAESERLMDEGKIPWVWSKIHGQYERLAVAPQIMDELGLQQGQNINSILLDAIAELSVKLLSEKLDEITQSVQDQFLTDDFDFRKEMEDDNDITNT